MFTGIIEGLGRVKNVVKEGTNIHFTIEGPFTDELKIDQSVAHNGVCLTVVEISGDSYVVTAIQETLNRTNLGDWKEDTLVNLERCTQMNGRLDGHVVQGHVDTVAECIDIKELDGSTEFFFEYNSDQVTVEKGSITVNGVSLTVVHSGSNTFSVAIIPYTLEHTNLKKLHKGAFVNIEFDIIGKYVKKLLDLKS